MRHQCRRFVAVFAAIALLPAWAVAQGGTTVSGRVTSEAGAPLANVNVFIADMGVGSLTKSDGSYSFVIAGARVSGQQARLTARLIGFREQTATITLTPGTITHDFTLAANPLRLGEVIVTGEGTATTREKLGNVINTVDSTAIARSNESNVVNALAAKAPNVEIQSQSGEPGASSYIRIRGPKSITGNGQPLFVVDGVPIDNTTFSTTGNTGGTVAPNRASDIDPADIESVQILKGAAAAAIYGARAAQGVVLITTKSGRPGPTRFSLRSSYSWDDVNQGVPLQQKFGQTSTCSTADCRANSGSWGDPIAAGTPTYDHFSEMFETGHVLDNNLTISGGNDKTSFYLSAGRNNADGTIVGPNNFYKRTSVRLNASHRLLDQLSVGGNIAYVDANGSFIQKGSNVSGLLLGALRTPPDFNNRPYLDPESHLQRSYRYPHPSTASATEGRGYDNPFFVVNEDPATEELNRVFGNLNATFTPTDWLTLKEVFGGDYYGDYRLEGLPQSSSSYPNGMLTRLDILHYSIDQTLNATATHTFSPNFSATLTLGQNLNSRRSRFNTVQGFNLIAPEPFALQNTTSWDPSESRSLIHTESYFGQATADLWNQLYLTAAVRNDGFSTFGAAKRRFWFPKVSGAWLFTNALGHTDGQGLLSYGKVRLAYGETGKEPPVYATLTTLTSGGFRTGWGDFLNPTQSGNGGLRTSARKGNADVRPERTKELETGVDLGLFDQKADLGVTYYSSRSEDVLLSAPVDPTTGYSSVLKNAAVITNKGWEATLNVRPVTTENFAWDFGLQWSHNDNNVEDLLGAEFVDKAGGTFSGAYGAVTKGVGVGVIRGQDFARCGLGLVIDGVDIDAACGNAPKGAMYIAADGFPIADPTDRVIGDPNPDWLGSARTSLRFGKWRVSGLVDVKHGGQMWNGTRGALYNFGTHKDTEIRGQKRTFGKDFHPGAVAGPGAGTAVVIDEDWFTGLGNGFGPVASQFMEDASFVKLREISVAYTFDQPWVQRTVGLNSIDVRVAGRNLHTWTDYTGIDPESNLAGAEELVQGIDYFNNPQTRSIVLSIGLNR